MKSHQKSGFNSARAATALVCAWTALLPNRCPAPLANVSAGQSTFNGNCKSCHNTDLVYNPLKVFTGARKSQLLLRGNGTVSHGGGTFPFNGFTDTDYNNLAAYLGSIDATNYSVQGRVYTKGGAVANVAIAITSAYNTDYNLLTDSAGNFKQTLMRPGDYLVTPTKLSYVFTPVNRSISMTWSNLLGGTNSPQLTTANGGALSNVNFLATYDPFEISGTVTTPVGQPISNATVSISSATNATDALGKYLLADLTAGTYTVVPSKPAHLFIPAPITVELTELTRKAVVDYVGGTNAIVRVKRVGGNDANDGSTWVLAKSSVTGAVAVAMQEIWVAGATNLAGPLPFVENISLRPGLALYSGFVGTETDRDQRNPAMNVAVLDGNLDRVVDMQSLFDGGVTKSLIDGFTLIRGGNQGAGIRVRDSGQTVSNCRFLTNTSPNSGGAIWVSGGAPLITGNLFISNSAAFNGGAIFCDGNPTLVNNYFRGNVAQDDGGAVHIRDGVVANNLLVANRSIGNGAGVYVSLGAALIANNTIVSNTSVANFAGGIHCANGTTATLANNIVAFNRYGIRSADASTPTLFNNCVFSNGPSATFSNYFDLSPGANDISADPMFVNLAALDFHLQSSSPCVEAGDNSVLDPNWRDLDGMFRRQGPFVDIGADELTTQPVVAVAPAAAGLFTVCWPVWATNWLMEMTTNLSTVPIVWQPVMQSPVAVGNQVCLTNATVGDAEFYRLRHP